ncbi:TIGR03086 family metal-binding protein [Streptomyces sp. NBC_01511]|uniref:TIGR03086 family metal-binding protein n=1 Tax=unclassified Streptomyces TaxID=2593676 RepID=UPI00386DB179
MSDMANRYALLADAFLTRVRAVPENRWDNRSPCRGWTARDVVAHVINGHRGILAAVHHTPPTPAHGVLLSPMGDAPAVEPGADLPTAFAACRDGLLTVLRDPALAARPLPGGPLGPVPVEQAVDVIGALELLGHSWDLARATGGDETLDLHAVTRTHTALTRHHQALLATAAFDPAIPAPEGADAQTSFLCFIGRSPEA